MIAPFEAILTGTPAKREVFETLCRSVFHTPNGQELLTLLCAAAHPMAHLSGMTEHEHGRSEVVATLWRFGVQNVVKPPPQPNPEPTSQDHGH
ncbi:MAG: hypothetical protein JWO08_1691 [Verrucomicrobiaceae bacterium]|nr:hypothetical protein [Verrucomicrobiaceae bacterium]